MPPPVTRLGRMFAAVALLLMLAALAVALLLKAAEVVVVEGWRG